MNTVYDSYIWADEELEPDFEYKFRQNDIDEKAEFLEGIIDELYGKNRLNTEIIEHCLDELAGFFSISFPKNQLNIQRKS